MPDEDRSPRADPERLRRRARARRRNELLAGWALVTVVAIALWTGGPWFLIVPLGALGALVTANTVASARGRCPEEQALTPGRLLRATADADPVAVEATWAPRRRARDAQRHTGLLTWGRGRLCFTAHAIADRTGREQGALPPGTALLDAEPHELRLGPPPSLWRPQLVLHHGGTTHVIDLSPAWDMASIGVGVLIAGEWYRQLLEVGVRPS